MERTFDFERRFVIPAAIEALSRCSGLGLKLGFLPEDHGRTTLKVEVDNPSLCLKEKEELQLKFFSEVEHLLRLQKFFGGTWAKRSTTN